MNFLAQEIIPNHNPIHWINRKIMHAIFELKTSSLPISLTKDSSLYKITLMHKKNIKAQIVTLWHFRFTSNLQIRIEMVDQQSDFIQPDPSVAVDEILMQMNRQSLLGNYFTNPKINHLLAYRYSVPISVLRNYVSGTISQIFWEASQQFTKYAVKLKLIGGTEDIKSSKVHVALIKLQHMKEQIQMSRLSRDKSLKYYNLTNCSVKIVDDALKVIGYQKGLLDTFKVNGNGKTNQKKIDRCRKVKNKTLDDIKVYQAEMKRKTQPQEIARGIEINKVVSENKIDQGGFSYIYRGEYVVNFFPTINPHLLKTIGTEGEESETIQKKLLVRKTLKPEQKSDSSFENELNFLKFVRNQKHPRFSGYYLPAYVQRKDGLQETQEHRNIYLQYYKKNLYEVLSYWKTLEPRLNACQQIFESVNFLANKNILHRDLKELNILVDNQSSLKLIDFGSSCGIYNQKPIPGCFTAIENQLMSTKNYYYPYSHLVNQYPIIAKEYNREQYNRAQTFDLYSAGTIITNMFHLNQQYFDSMVHHQLNYLVSKCHQRNPADRPTTKEAYCYIYLIVQLNKALQTLDSVTVKNIDPEILVVTPLEQFKNQH